VETETVESMAHPIRVSLLSAVQQRHEDFLEGNDTARTLFWEAPTLTPLPCDPAACNACNQRLMNWWTVSNWMKREDRVALQAALRFYGVALPAGPWEDA
jgi:hypothetical protein